MGILDRLYGRPVRYVCGNDQDVLVFARTLAGGGAIVMAANLNSEPMRSVRLRAPDAKSAYMLSQNGVWVPLDFARDGEWIDLPASLAFYEAKVFKVL